MAKTNWKFNDVVTEADMNQLGSELNAASEHVAVTSGAHGATSAATAGALMQRDASGRAKVAAPAAADDVARLDTVTAAVQPFSNELEKVAPVVLALTAGQQTVTVPRDTPLRIKSIKGRTLANLLGRVGNMDTISNWPGSNITVASDAVNSTTGSTGLKLTLGSGSPKTFYLRGDTGLLPKVKVGKYYIGIMDIKNSSLSPANVNLTIGTGSSRSNTIISSEFTAVWAKFNPTVDADCGIQLSVSGGTSGQVLYADSARIYEITSAEYSELDRMTPGQISIKYCYIDDIKNVNGVYMRKIAALAADDQYVFYPDCQLESSLDGITYDELYTDQTGQARVKRQFKSMDLTGDLGWEFSDTKLGSKQVRLPVSNQVIDSERVVKYDGKIITHIFPYSGADQSFMTQGTDNKLYLSIPVADSGWGDSYTPTLDEIKAYFYGWKMGYDNVGGFVSPYNGSGAKRWRAQIGDTSGGIASMPITMAGGGYKPYHLQCQLATPTDEPVRSEGAIMLGEGANRLEIGYGAVVRERARPYLVGAQYNVVINSTYAGPPDESSSKLTYRSAEMIGLYRNGKEDRTWKLESSAAFGQERYNTLAANYDPSAVYEVTYLALDTYLIGIPPTQISAEYPTNQRSVTDVLTKAATQLAGRVAVLENGTAQSKQPQWINATLLNGWVPYTDLSAQYLKSSDGLVYMRGLIQDGTATFGTTILRLPAGFRPGRTLVISTTANNGTEYRPAVLNLFTDGRLIIDTAGSKVLNLDGIVFRAEQ
ncbi:hypothetical protein SAMN05444162_3599 [Paenibacillaceae bacterium GAS479]|nr:hypothetical protein SAMN05444162_3599 [Paenibacillaceae bacterium GAS479]